MRRLRLAVNDAESDVVIAVEKRGRVTAALVAVYAGGIHIKASGDILREAVGWERHVICGLGLRSVFRTPKIMNEMH